jgi:hypothetical protein
MILPRLIPQNFIWPSYWTFSQILCMFREVSVAGFQNNFKKVEKNEISKKRPR